MNSRSWVRGPCIGGGAYGTVHLGFDTSDGAVFAVKSVDSSSALPCQLEALENEIGILKSLSSPFIVKYLGDDTEYYCSPTTKLHRRSLHMEYLPAGTAADLATTSADFDEAAIASYTWCLLSALSYLHSRGIVHCDVKGKNVLLDSSPGSTKLADFGSAMVVSAAGDADRSARGSPLWMAPEVIRGERQGPESDVWSLGCTVIEMVTGKPAWGADPYSACRIGYSEELPLFPARLSRLGIDFLEKCFRRDYTKRWSCDQLLQHPFISMRSQDYSIDSSSSSPRCVLDWFRSEFHRECEEEEEEIAKLGANERIRALVSDAGASSESDGWTVVRSRPEDCGGYSAPTGRINSNYSLALLREEEDYSHQNGVVAKQYDTGVYAAPCLQVNRRCQCNNLGLLSKSPKFIT